MKLIYRIIFITSLCFCCLTTAQGQSFTTEIKREDTDSCKKLSDLKHSTVEFSKTPLRKALTELFKSAQAPHRLLVSTSLDDIQVTGVAKPGKLDETLENLLNSVSQSSRIRHTIENCSLIVDSMPEPTSAKPSFSGVTPVSASSPTPVTPTALPVTPPIAPQFVYQLQQGDQIDTALKAWGRTAGWQVDWKLSYSWLVPASMNYGTNFEEAMTKAIESIYAEGVQIKLRIYEGNKVMEIIEYAGQ